MHDGGEESAAAFSGAAFADSYLCFRYSSPLLLLPCHCPPNTLPC